MGWRRERRHCSPHRVFPVCETFPSSVLYQIWSKLTKQNPNTSHQIDQSEGDPSEGWEGDLNMGIKDGVL